MKHSFVDAVRGVFSAFVTLATISAFAETYYFTGNDSSGNSALYGNRANAWQASSDGSLTQTPTAGNTYVINSGHTVNIQGYNYNFPGDLVLGETTDEEFTIPFPGSGKYLKFPKVTVNGDVTCSSADNPGTRTYEEGEWTINNKLTFNINKVSSSADISFKQTLLGSGELGINMVYAGGKASTVTIKEWATIYGDFSGFTGKATFTGNPNNNGTLGTHQNMNPSNITRIKFAEGSKFLGDPAEVTPDATEVGYINLWFDDDVTTGPNRGWKFSSDCFAGSGTTKYQNYAIIYVAEGKTVRIEGPVTMNCQNANTPFALKKYGLGKLVFTDVAEEDQDKVICGEGEVVFEQAGKCAYSFSANDSTLGTIAGAESGYYEPGVLITLTATPRDEECSFVRWEGDLPESVVDPTATTISFTTDDTLVTRNIVARFDGISRHIYTMQGNDTSTSTRAVYGNRANAWMNEIGESSTAIDPTGNYYVDGNNTILQNNLDFVFAGNKLVFTTNATAQSWSFPILSGGKIDIGNLVVDGALSFSGGLGDNILTGDVWSVNGKLTVSPACDQNKKSPFNFNAPLTGVGEFVVSYPSYNDSYEHKFLFNGAISNFTGKVTFEATANNADSSNGTRVEIPAEVAFFGEPDEFVADSISLNYMMLALNENITIGPNRGWMFKSRVITVAGAGGADVHYNQIPSIYVAEGKTVVIEGKVAFETTHGSPDAGLIKKGPGTLIIKDIDDADRAKVVVDDFNGGFIWFEMAGQYGLALSANKSILGKVTGSPAGYYAPGTEVTITAVPRDEECFFIEWSGDLPESVTDTTSATITFLTDDKSRNIIAVFGGEERHSYTMYGDDVNGKFALNGGRDNAWKDENGNFSADYHKLIDPTGNYYINSNNKIYPNLYAFVFGGHSLTFTENADNQEWSMANAANREISISTLNVDGVLRFHTGSGSNILTGETWTVNGKLSVEPRCNSGASSPLVFAAPLLGSGEFRVSYNTYSSLSQHKFLIAQDISGFTGKVTFSATADQKASSDNTCIEFAEGANFFGKAAVSATNSVEVSYVRLVFNDSVMSDKGRGWTFKSRAIEVDVGAAVTEHYPQIPVIYVAEGKTVQIKGPVTFECTSERQPYIEGSTYRLIKQGPGTLIINNWGSMSKSDFLNKVKIEEGEVILPNPLGTLLMIR